jgi:hypothetical protein
VENEVSPNNYPPGVTGNEPQITGEPEKKKEESLEDKLFRQLSRRFGNNWRRTLRVELRADSLSWIVKLALWGYEQRKKEIKEDKGKDICDVMSLVSFQHDLEQFVEAVCNGKEVKEKKKGKK